MLVFATRFQKLDVFIIEMDSSKIFTSFVVGKCNATKHARFDDVVIKSVVDTGLDSRQGIPLFVVDVSDVDKSSRDIWIVFVLSEACLLDF